MTMHDRSRSGTGFSSSLGLSHAVLLMLMMTLSQAEETRNGNDVGTLIGKANQGDLKALVEVAEHFLWNRETVYDNDPARDFPHLEKKLQAAAAMGAADANFLLGQLYSGDYPGVPVNRSKAVAAYEKAAQAGSINAMLSLANLYLNGSEQNAPDIAGAEKWAQAAVAKSPPESQVHSEARSLLESISFRREAADVRNALVKRADSGDREAQHELAGSLFDEATNEENNAKTAEAMRRLTQAAEAGLAAAQYDLFYKLYPTDPKAARAWMQKAVEQKYGPALGNAGLNYIVGDSEHPRDPAKGIDLILQAVQAGSTTAATALVRGDFFTGMTETDARTLRYANNPTSLAKLTAAAERGEARAQYWLGAYHELSDGAASTAWLAKAAAQGHPGAMYSLSIAYNNGRGVPRDLAQAHFWLTRAALLTHAEAQWSLAYHYLNGTGTAADASLARYWFSFSANSLPAESSYRDDAKKRAAAMTAPMPTREAVWASALAAHAQARLPGEALAAPTAIAANPPSPSQPAPPKTLTLDEHRKAAEAGNAESMYQLGLADLKRRQIESNNHTGPYYHDPQRNAMDFRWILSAARAGHPEAQFLAATHWLSAETDAGKKSWLEKAAAQGHTAAKERLAANAKATENAVAAAAAEAKTNIELRALAARGDPDAAARLLRTRIGEITKAIIDDFTAGQNGQPTSGKNLRLGQLDAEMTQWMDTAIDGVQLDAVTLMHDYLRDDQPETAYLLLLFREHLARIESRLALADNGFGTKSRAGFEKALAFLRGKLPADQRSRIENIANTQWSGPWLDNRLARNFELGICGFPTDPDLARAWSAKAAAHGADNKPATYRISASIRQQPKPVATMQTTAPAQVDELDLLKSKVGSLRGKTVFFGNTVYQAPDKIIITGVDDTITLTAVGSHYTYSYYYGRKVFGTRLLTEMTTTVKVRDLIRYIENVSGAYIVTETGPCGSCSGQGSFWDNQSRTRTGCSACNSTGCAPRSILNNGATRAY